MALLPKVKLKAMLSFPSAILDGAGIDVTRVNGAFKFNIAFDDFAPPVTGVPDAAHQNALLWNSATNTYVLAPISVLGAAGTVPEAPNDGVQYGRKSLSWTPVVSGTTVSPSNTNPAMDGTAAPGTATLYSRGDHVHPSDTTKIGEAPLDGQAYARKNAAWSVATGGTPSNVAPVVDGTATPGVSALYSRGDHVHPTDNTRQASDTDLTAVAALTSTGIARRTSATPSWSAGDPVVNTELSVMPAFTLKGNNFGGLASPTDVDIAGLVSKTSPGGGDYVLLSDQAASGAWKKLPVSSFPGASGGIGEAPNDGLQYGRQSLGWTQVSGGGTSPSNALPIMDSAANAGVSSLYSRGDHVHPSDSTKAPLASPALTGTPTAPTATDGTNTTQLATTAFVTTALAGVPASGVTFAPTGNIAATNVQAALAEVDTEKVAKAGDTMTGALAINATFLGGSAPVGQLSLSSTAATGAGGVVDIYQNRTAAANDLAGIFRFFANNSSAVKTQYGAFNVSLVNPAAGSESGVLTFQALLNGAMQSIQFSGSALLPVGVSIALGGAANFWSALYLSSAATLYIGAANCTPRERLTADRTYFVATTGNDSNNGLTVGNSFLTIQNAINVIYNQLDIGPYTATIQVGAGTYTTPIVVTGTYTGSGAISMVGDATTPSNVVISTTGNSGLSLFSNARLSVSGFKFTTASSGSCVKVFSGAQLNIQNIVMGACAESHFSLGNSSVINASAAGVYTINGSAGSHIHCTNSALFNATGGTITLSGTPAFSDYFIGMAQNANSLWSGITFSGSGTGTRFLIHTGAQVTLDGTNNLTFFPGNASGIVYEGGTYDKIFSTGGVAVSSLPAPNVGIAGARNLVVDANSTTFMSTVAGGGANIVPVVCDGTNWKIG